jgi:hypothetical protein
MTNTRSASAYDWATLAWWETAPDAADRVPDESAPPVPQGQHRFSWSDGGIVECITCGAVYDTIASGDAVAPNGMAPTPCTQNTSMVHGDRRENGHDLDCPGGFSGSCESCDALCNCALCA